MSAEGAAVEIPKQTEHQRLRAELETGFHNFVAGQTNLDHLKSPSFMTEGKVNPAWAERQKHLNRRLSGWSEGDGNNEKKTAGKLLYNKETKTWTAEDKDSPIGKIEALQQKAREALERPVNPQQQKTEEAEIRKALVDIYNDYAGKHFNLQRDVVDGRDFAGMNLNNMSYRSLTDLRMDLVRTRKQSIEPMLFDRWTKAPTSSHTPSRADEYIDKLMQELARKEKAEEPLGADAQTLNDLFKLQGPEGYKALANALYGGDMEKTYINLSSLVKKHTLSRPEGWQLFQGSTTEFRNLQEQFRTFSGGIEGYLQAADLLYGGAMQKTYINLSAVARMTGKTLPEGWQGFQDSTTEFRNLQEQISTFSGGIDGYLNAADLLYDGAMKKTYINLSACAQMTAQTLPEGWQAFHGSTTEFRTQREWLIRNPSVTAATYMKQFLTLS